MRGAEGATSPEPLRHPGPDGTGISGVQRAGGPPPPGAARPQAACGHRAGGDRGGGPGRHGRAWRLPLEAPMTFEAPIFAAPALDGRHPGCAEPGAPRAEAAAFDVTSHRAIPGGAAADARGNRPRHAGRADPGGPAPGYRRPEAAGPAARAVRGGSARRAAPPGRPEHRGPLHDRAGLLRHAHPGGDPPQRAGEPGLVHGLYPVPAGDLAGAARGAAHLPDPHRGPDLAAGGRGLPAGRGNRGRGGHDAGPAGGPARPDLPGRRGLPAADPGRAGHPGRAARDRARGRPGHPGAASRRSPRGSCSGSCCSTRGPAGRSGTSARPSRPRMPRARWRPWPPTCWP